tara:strand:- start:196 stop:462 length:267 start_codon:yes stop_codon:yes gene_type:complete
MFKELKYLFFLFIIISFLFFSLNYYFSDKNKKNSYRSLKLIDKKIHNYSQNVVLLKNNTNNIVEYIEKTIDKNKKNYNFWKLIIKNEK